MISLVHPDTIRAEKRRTENRLAELEIALLDEYDRQQQASDLYTFISESFLDSILYSVRVADGGLEMASCFEIPQCAARELARKRLRAEGVL